MNISTKNNHISPHSVSSVIHEQINLFPQRSVEASHVDVLTEIYKDDVNIVVWQRDLENKLTTAVNALLAHNPLISKVCFQS